LLNRFLLRPVNYDIGKDGIPIVTPEVEKALKQRKVMTWMVATIWRDIDQ